MQRKYLIVALAVTLAAAAASFMVGFALYCLVMPSGPAAIWRSSGFNAAENEGGPGRRAKRPVVSAASASAVRFSGADRVEIKSAPDLEFGQRPFTISFWFRTTTSRQYLTFASKRRSTLGDGWVIHAQDSQFLFYAAGCASPLSSPQSFRDGKWHHLVVVRQEGRLDFFHDSQLVGSGPERCNFRDSHPLRLGMDADEGHHFEGELAEVHIYGRALSPAEVATEWNSGQPRREPVGGADLVAGYHFDETPQGRFKDFSGTGHDGTFASKPSPERQQ